MKKNLKQFFMRDIDGFVKNNSVTSVLEFNSDNGSGVKISTNNGNVYFFGMTMKDYKKTHCSCVNMRKAHFSAVANMLSECFYRSTEVFIDN